MNNDRGKTTEGHEEIKFVWGMGMIRMGGRCKNAMPRKEQGQDGWWVPQEGSSRVGTTPYVILVDRRAVYSYYGPGRGTKRRARPARVYSLLLRSNAVTTMYCRSKYEQQQVRNYCSNTGVVE